MDYEKTWPATATAGPATVGGDGEKGKRKETLKEDEEGKGATGRKKGVEVEGNTGDLVGMRVKHGKKVRTEEKEDAEMAEGEASD